MAEAFFSHTYDVVYISILDFGLKFLKPVWHFISFVWYQLS